MKRMLFLSLVFAGVNVFAQGPKLETGKKITATTNSSMNMDMGVAGQMKIDGTSTNLIQITGADDKNYKATNTTTKMTLSQEGMGQTVSFDSDKKEDRESEVGKEMSKMLNVAAEIMIEKNSGKVTEINKKIVEVEDDNPMAALTGAGNKSVEATTAAAFFYIPAGKKVGDTWSDSVSENGMKGLKTFELQSVKDNIATVAVKTKSKGSISKEMQGMQMEISMDGTSLGVIIVDIKTGLVKKNTQDSDVTGTLDMMGQSIPLTIKMTSNSDYN